MESMISKYDMDARVEVVMFEETTIGVRTVYNQYARRRQGDEQIH